MLDPALHSAVVTESLAVVLGCAAILRDLAERLEGLPSVSTTWGDFLAPLAEYLERQVVPVVDGYIGDLYSDLATFTIRHFG
jgi:hypothetical protein